MYRLNNLYRPVLITPDEVIAKSPTSHTMDQNKVLHSIEIAEERFIRPALGFTLYKAICKEKNTLVTSGNIAALQALVTAADVPGQLKEGQLLNSSSFLSEKNRELWDFSLWKLVAECVRFTVIPEAYAQLTENGILKSNPITSALGTAVSTSAGIDLKDAQWLMNQWQSTRLDPLLESLHNYICSVGGFAGYEKPCPCTDGDSPVEQTRKTDWALDLYDDETPCPCW